ncbi:MAG: hypothetical protein H0T49_04570 [Chloroflexia bacterium]|nr:hypothetical protein [Chloroflexia bacterium]
MPLMNALPRYNRPHETAAPVPISPSDALIPFAAAEAAIATSALSEGGRNLALGLLRLGCIKAFAGGGVGIEYGGLLKTAARPEYLAAHVAEAAAHLRERRIDLLLVPGMSGYPVGAMYSVVSGIPAVLLKKNKLDPGAPNALAYPEGAFVIPSYTGEGEVVISADLDAVQEIVDGIVAPQLAAQTATAAPVLTLRAAGADDIIDKATMSQAVSDSALVVGRAAIADFIRRHREATGDPRPIDARVDVVAWVTPIIKGYNDPHAHLWRTFGLRPFAGINVTGVQLDPPALGIEGLGIIAFRTDEVGKRR